MYLGRSNRLPTELLLGVFGELFPKGWKDSSHNALPGRIASLSAYLGAIDGVGDTHRGRLDSCDIPDLSYYMVQCRDRSLYT